MNATGPFWWLVNNGTGNGLVPSGNRPLAEQMTQIPGITRPQWVKSRQWFYVFFRGPLLQGVWYHTARANPFLTGWSWPSGRDTQRNSGWQSCLETLGPAFETGFQCMKQFTDNWYLPCCKCAETCSYVSSIQKKNNTAATYLFLVNSLRPSDAFMCQ